MKRTASIIRDIAEISVLLALVGIFILAEVNVNAQTTQPQDLYQIEQTFEHDYRIGRLFINRGWDAHLIQTPEGTPTRLVVTTACADFFEEGAEPELFKIEKLSKRRGSYILVANQWMPRTTKVEIYTSQPLYDIKLEKGARLTIHYYDFDSVDLDIYADTGAVLVIDTLNNRYSTDITVSNATLDLRHFSGNKLVIDTYGESTVKEGDVKSRNQWLTMGEKTTSNITATDSTRHIYVKTKKSHDRERKLFQFTLGLGLGVATPITWVDNSRYGSPYNTNYGFIGQLPIRFNEISISRHWSWNFGLDASWSYLQLDNAVKVQGDQLVLDPSYGATPPRQELYWWAIGVPVTLKYSFDNWLKNIIPGIYVTLTPTFNFTPRLVTKSLDADDHWHTDREKVDILNRFNIRAAIGFNCFLGGAGRLELFTDLLPTYKSSADAPQTRMFGLNFIF